MIANLKMIAQMLSISIDDLLNDEYELSDSIIDEEKKDTGCEVYEGYYWDILLPLLEKKKAMQNLRTQNL